MTMLDKVFRVRSSDLDNLKAGVLEAVDDFKTQGYILQAGKALGLESEDLFLFISAPIEFFLKNSEALKPYPEIEGEEGADIIRRIREQEKASQSGLGFVLGQD